MNGDGYGLRLLLSFGRMRFVQDGSGTLISIQGVSLGGLIMEEREAVMGFERGIIKVVGISNSERSRMLGNAFDLNVMIWLVSLIWVY